MIQHEKVVVLGAGESGTGAALLAKQKQKVVFVSDYGQISEIYKNILINNNIPFEEKGHDFDKLKNADVIVKSPGISSKTDVVKFLKKQGIEIVSEIEYGSWFYKGTIIAITGSNGKTTTTKLIHHILSLSGMSVGVGGNIGDSFCKLLAQDNIADTMVLEVSSFQLDDVYSFRPSIGVLLNITADHLDRYENNIQNYAKAKCNIWKNMKAEDTMIVNGNDALILKYLESCKAENIKILEAELEKIEGVQLKGKHNAFNISCATEVAKRCSVSEEQIISAVREFKPVKHRLETIAFVDGIEFINDSKATNTDAVKYAIQGVEKKIVWIAGGTDKGNDYSELFPLIENKVETLICLGLDNSKLKKSFQGKIENIIESREMIQAVSMAYKAASRGEVVMLSPACASFDLFDNYEHRGLLFEEAVFGLVKN
jgi:UDP-N-acetylmuramoylalanine--D-glutamate ligase